MRSTQVIVMILAAVLWAGTAQAVSPKTITLQDAATADGNGEVAPVSGFTTTVVQAAGTFDATINLEWSVDGANYEPLECVSTADRNNRGTTMIAQGGMRCNLIGMNKFRARISSYVSGSITVTGGFASAGVF